MSLAGVGLRTFVGVVFRLRTFVGVVVVALGAFVGLVLLVALLALVGVVGLLGEDGPVAGVDLDQLSGACLHLVDHGG